MLEYRDEIGEAMREDEGGTCGSEGPFWLKKFSDQRGS